MFLLPSHADAVKLVQTDMRAIIRKLKELTFSSNLPQRLNSSEVAEGWVIDEKQTLNYLYLDCWEPY